jgi:hypothetical protein
MPDISVKDRIERLRYCLEALADIAADSRPESPYGGICALAGAAADELSAIARLMPDHTPASS